MIDGVVIAPQNQISDERGKIMHMMKSTDPHFDKFGEIYFTCAWPNAIKAWHIHKRMTMNNFCVVGYVKLVLFDMRENSPTKDELMEIFIGEDNRQLVKIPPGVCNGYKAYGDRLAIMANCATEVHDKNEIIYIPYNSEKIPYNWDIKHG